MDNGRKDFEQAIQQGFNVIPVWKEILADLDTPVSCYMKMKSFFQKSKGFFLLESVEGGERLGRYSTVGCNPVARLNTHHDMTELVFWSDSLKDRRFSANPFTALDDLLQIYQAPPDRQMMGGLYGALAYDVVRYLEPIPGIKIDSQLPEAAFFMAGDLMIFDHLKRTIKLIAVIYLNHDEPRPAVDSLYEGAQLRLAALEEALKTPCPVSPRIDLDLLQSQNDHLNPWSSSFKPSDFEGAVLQAKEYIKQGEVFQLVLSQKMTQTCERSLDPLMIYRLLRSLNPTPYQFLFDFQDFQIIGSSPEMMLKCSSDQAVLRPIAGTYRRGSTEEEDQKLTEELRSDPKELAEHLMLVDLARNDLGRIAKPGTVRPTALMIVEKYSHVLHLVSEIVAQPQSGVNTVEILKAVFPAGTLSGAPKVRAMQLIAGLEPVARGFYAGCVGYIGFEGFSNTAMTIRTLILSDNCRKVEFQAGAGIVYDSDPGKEYQETINKGAAILKVLEQIMHSSSP